MKATNLSKGHAKTTKELLKDCEKHEGDLSIDVKKGKSPLQKLQQKIQLTNKVIASMKIHKKLLNGLI